MTANRRPSPASPKPDLPGPFVPPPGSIPTLDIPDPSSWRCLHFIGIGGAGMSGIARLLLARGVRVSGSDLKESAGLDALRQAGAKVFVGHRAGQIGRPDAVVVSSAIPATNPEVEAARQAGVPVLMRAQVLAALMRERRSIAVSGTHGKTTTTSMVSVMLARAGLDPTYVIGGDLNESGSGAGHGRGELFVAEADESDGSFLLLRPDIGVVTNVEEDHLDFYADGREIEAAFAEFCRSAGSVVACIDDPGTRRVIARAGSNLVTYGQDGAADLVLVDADVTGPGARGVVEAGGRRIDLALSAPGLHTLLNATAALAVAELVGLPLEAAAEALRAFTGVRRRFEHRGDAQGATFVDDYAHHPTEVRATLEAARTFAGSGDNRRLVAVFQPHRYTRTEVLWRALGESLDGADVVVVTDVYAAGERPIPGVTGKLLVDALTESAPGKRVVYLPRRADVTAFLADQIGRGDLVLTLGAGDITMVGEETLDRIRERSA
jgi:UDP-N-acetylmuramate--alanine ligase